MDILLAVWILQVGLSPLVTINLIDGVHVTLSGRPTNYDMIRTELRGARELDMKDPLGRARELPEPHRRILAWTALWIWLYN